MGVRESIRKVERPFSILVTKTIGEVEVKSPDQLPQGKTEEDLRKEHPTLVYCNLVRCKWNKAIPGLVQSPKSVLNWLEREPWADDPEWRGVCSRGSIAINLKEIKLSGGAKYTVPACFTYTTGPVGHMDFSKITQGWNIPDSSDESFRKAQDRGDYGNS